MKKGELYIGVSSDKQTLKEAENEGVVTSLLKFALKIGMVDVVVAVRKGKNRYEGVLSFITEPDEINKCTGSFHFTTPVIAKNVKKYLDTYNKKIAVVCKSCDARALIELAKIGQVNIENIIMIGINCSGTLAAVPHINMLRESGIDPYRLIYEEIDGNKLTLKFNGAIQRTFSLNELEENGLGRRRNCQRCEYPIPRMADLACGKWGLNGERGTFIELCSTKGKELFDKAVSEGLIEIKAASKEQIKLRNQEEFEKIDFAKARQKENFTIPEDKFYWLSQMQACIKCYGCRDACPLCHCKRCVLERDVPKTVEKGVIPPPPTFGMIRLFHVACYCVNCGQCEDVCSSDIPISRLAHYLNKQSTDLFDYESGLNLDIRLPLSTVPEGERISKSTNLEDIIT
jgi:formate dehydrogenase subunit beta